MSERSAEIGDEPPWLAAAIWQAMEQWPEETHLRVAENETACVRGGDRSLVDVWGEYLTDDTSEVGCSRCKEWIHA